MAYTDAELRELVCDFGTSVDDHVIAEIEARCPDLAALRQERQAVLVQDEAARKADGKPLDPFDLSWHDPALEARHAALLEEYRTALLAWAVA